MKGHYSVDKGRRTNRNGEGWLLPTRSLGKDLGVFTSLGRTGR